MSGAVEVAHARLQGELGRSARVLIGPVGAVAAQRFAVATGDDNPVYFDGHAARAAGYESTAVPPLLLTSTRNWGAGPVAGGLAEDGTPLADIGLPGGLGLRVMGGGQQIVIDGDVCADTDLVADFTLLDATCKSGRSGDLLVVELERTFLDAAGNVLVRCNEQRILR